MSEGTTAVGRSLSRNRENCIGLLAASVLLGLAACGGPSAGTKAQGDCKDIPITSILPITGAGATIGAEWKRGAEAAVERVNESGISVGGSCHHFKLTVEDSQTTPDQAIGAAQRMLRNGGRFMSVQLSTLFTPTWESVQGNDILVFTSATTADPLLGTKDGKHLFRSYQVEEGSEGSLQAFGKALAGRYSPKRAAILLPADPPGEIQRREVAAGLKQSGVEVVYSQSFAPAVRDFAPFVASIKDIKPDLVVTGYLPTAVKPFLQQAIQAGLTSPVFAGTPGSSATDVKGLDGITRYAFAVSTRAVDNPGDPQVKAFRQTYEKRNGTPPSSAASFALQEYEHWQMLAKAMEIAGSVDDLDAIAKALHSAAVGKYPGRALDLTFGEKNQGRFTPQVGYLENGQLTYADSK